HNSLPLSWKDDDHAKAFEKFRKLDSNYKQRLLAFCVSGLINVRLHSHDPDENNPLTEMVIKLLGIKWHEYWRPTVDNFYSSLTKDQLTQLGIQHYQDEDSWKVIAARCNKNELAARVEELIREKAPNWMPEGFESK